MEDNTMLSSSSDMDDGRVDMDMDSDKTAIEVKHDYKEIEHNTLNPQSQHVKHNNTVPLTAPKMRSFSRTTSMTIERRSLAALKLQKVYKSFRTRRQLADCAVLAEHKWWQVLELAELKHSSISFFDIEKSESVLSKWSRVTTKAAKVGKGLSKDKKARKLALQHWLEAIDPRHRYGHNLQFYYVKWLNCESRQPFFYWLDVGDGKEVNVVERCPRSRLQQQCIKYLDPAERDVYEVIVENGKFKYKHSQELVDTTRKSKETKWIFVLSATKNLYVGPKIKGKFQHSSFLSGGATLSAGRLVAENGILKAVWPHSGHYLPTEENFQAFVSFLRENDVDLTWVKRSPIDEEDELKIDGQMNSKQDEINNKPQVSKLSEVVNSSIFRIARFIQSKFSKLDMPKKCDVVEEEFKTPTSIHIDSDIEDFSSSDVETDDYKTPKDYLLSEDDFISPKLNIFQQYEHFGDEEPIPQETIMRRINSHRRTKSYQLGEHLQFKWTTGAGPRIGCVRDYPSRLQFQVLEQVNLSPRSRSNDSSPLSTLSCPNVLGCSRLSKGENPSRLKDIFCGLIMRQKKINSFGSPSYIKDFPPFWNIKSS